MFLLAFLVVLGAVLHVYAHLPVTVCVALCVLGAVAYIVEKA